MVITPAEIEQLTFSCCPCEKGYSPQEVDSFLERLTDEIDAMLQKIADLKTRLTNAESQLAAAQSENATLKSQAGQGVSTSTEILSSGSDATAQQISRALIVAQQSADTIVNEAKETAAQIRDEADTKAREVIRQALAEKQNELDEIDRLKQSCEDFRSEYKTLLRRFMDDADEAFSSAALAGAGLAARPDAQQASSKLSNAYGSGGHEQGSGNMNLGDLD